MSSFIEPSHPKDQLILDKTYFLVDIAHAPFGVYTVTPRRLEPLYLHVRTTPAHIPENKSDTILKFTYNNCYGQYANYRIYRTYEQAITQSLRSLSVHAETQSKRTIIPLRIQEHDERK